MARLILHRSDPVARPADEIAAPRVANAVEPVAASDGWGVLLLLPAREVPVLSLWELWRGRRGQIAALSWDQIADVMAWKDEIAAGHQALFSRWLGGRQAFLSLDLLPAVLRLVGSDRD